MSRVPLGGSEETHVIFDGDIPTHLSELDATDQRDVLKKLQDIAGSSAPPDAFVYEQIKNIDVLKFSEKGRIYSKIVTGIPQGNTHYHVVYVLYVDDDHDYDQSDLAEYNITAQNKLNRITRLTELEDVEWYLDDRDSLSETDLTDLLE